MKISEGFLGHITELTDGGQLRKEGAELHHCVASYADRCFRGVPASGQFACGRVKRSTTC